MSPYNGADAMATVGLQICDVVDCLPRKKDLLENRQECVLLIEDSEEAMLLVRYALQEYGNGTYRLEWADGLTAGLHRLGKGGIDLVILDLGLPESSGPASYAAIRKAAADLPILVLTGDTREQTEFAVSAEGADDFLVKEEVSGTLLLEAIRTALYSNQRWRAQRNSNHKLAPRFLWAQEKCQALGALGSRMLKLNRIDSAIGCAKAMSAIVNDYSQSEKASLSGRAELFVSLERLARAAAALKLNESARRFRAMITPVANSPAESADEFFAAVRRSNEELDRQSPSGSSELPALPDSADLAQVLRQILESVPTKG